MCSTTKWIIPHSYHQLIPSFQKQIDLNINDIQTIILDNVEYNFKCKLIKRKSYYDDEININYYIKLLQIRNHEYVIKINDSKNYAVSIETFYASDVIQKQRVSGAHGGNIAYTTYYDLENLPTGYGSLYFHAIYNMKSKVNDLFYDIDSDYRLPYYDLSGQCNENHCVCIKTNSNHILYQDPKYNSIIKFDLQGYPLYGISTSGIFIYNSKYKLIINNNNIIIQLNNVAIMMTITGELIKYHSNDLLYISNSVNSRYNQEEHGYDINKHPCPNIIIRYKSRYDNYIEAVQSNGWCMHDSYGTTTRLYRKKNNQHDGMEYGKIGSNYIISNHDTNHHVLHDDNHILMIFKKIHDQYVLENYIDGLIQARWLFTISEIIEMVWYVGKKPKYKISALLEMLKTQMGISLQ